MASPILVIGHRNPDNDSICAAVGYAYLKNQLAKRDENSEDAIYIPCRLGPLPPESERILAENNIEAPRVIMHVHARVADVMTHNPISILHNDTVMEAGRRLRKHNIRSLVVENDDGTFAGLIATREIANRYIEATDLLDEAQGDSDAVRAAVAQNLISSLTQKVSDLTASNVITLDKEDLLKDAVDDLMASDLREAVVLDSNNRAIGIVTRSDIAKRPKRKVILVDHNETRQSAPGIEGAEVVEIIDHHRIADVMTSNPIRFLNLPVGSTATIVANEFFREGIDMPNSIAAVLLSAIMTDTVILKSPTATPVDHDTVARLAAQLEVDPTEFGLKIFKMKGGEDGVAVKQLVEADSKEFQMGDFTVLIAQHETVDLPGVMQREQEIREHMRSLQEARKYEFVLFMITDIIAEGSQFICEGNRAIVNRIFGIDCKGQGGTWMPGILSRKKQVAAMILD